MNLLQAIRIDSGYIAVNGDDDSSIMTKALLIAQKAYKKGVSSIPF